MSFSTLGREVLRESRAALNNRKLRKADILEWSTGNVQAEDGEIVVKLPTLGVSVCVPVAADRRKK